jgi:Uma2 family endonuclease
METATIEEQTAVNDKQHDQALLSGEDLFEMGDIGRAELVEGKLHLMAPTGYEHGISENRVGSMLREYVDRQRIGEVLTGEVGIYTGRSPDTVRGADVLYISNERFAKVQSESYLDVAPELIVEIISPSDRWSCTMKKLEEYFNIGVKAVWIVEPKNRTVRVYRSPISVERFAEGDTLACEDVLPGFQCSISALFVKP